MDEGGASVIGGGGGLAEKPRDPITFEIELSAATGGEVFGSGVYPRGQLAICKASADKGFYFDRWTGDLKGMKEYCTFQVEKDIESTAYFSSMLGLNRKPCSDETRGVTNPLVDMRLAPTSKGKTNFIGSTYGMTRYSGTTFHSGIDLYAEPGTPLYAICDGTISESRYVTEQPMRDKDDNYPPGYSGDDNDAGNRFTLESNINGKAVNFSYWHLNEGTPIAINPRTGKPFNKGDKVYRGELIAYSGKTGNAYNVSFPHLHLTVKDGRGNYLNPEDYINGSVSDTLVNGSRSVYDTEIVDVKCDEEEKNEYYLYPDSPIR